MSKTLYIHIGNFKTGTSAIQKFCSENYDSLKSSGLYYFQSCRPDNNITNHGRLSLELFKDFNGTPPEWYNDSFNYVQAVQEIRDEINNNHDIDDFLISSEEFYRLGGITESRNALLKLKKSFEDLDIQIKIIMYAREPLDFLVSWYNQITKGSVLPTKTFVDFVSNIANYYTNPYINYNIWSNVFGEKNIIVKEYKYNGNEHIKDFITQMIPGFDLPISNYKVEVNAGLQSKALEKKRLKKLVYNYFPQNSDRVSNLNDYLNSQVMLDAKLLRRLNEKINLVYNENNKFFKEFFESEVSRFDIFDVIEHSSTINYFDIRTFWEFNPAIDNLIRKASSLKKSNASISLDLFQIAQEFRPGGRFIKDNISELYNLLELNKK